MKRVLVCVVTCFLVTGLARQPQQIDAAPRDPYLLTIPKTGKVLHTPTLRAVFWGPEWNDSSFATDIVSGLDQLLSSYSGSQYAAILREYSDRSGSISGY